MKKILHIIPSLELGGTEKILLQICTLLQPGFQHYVVALKYGGATEKLLRKRGINVTLLHSPNSFAAGLLDMPRLFFSLRNIIRREKFDLVQTWLSRANVIGRLAATGCNVAVISALRVIETEKNYHLWLENATQNLCKVITVNSNSLKKFALEKIQLDPKKLRLIPNGITLPITIDAQKMQQFRNLYQDKFLIGTIGRLHQQKGQDILLRAAAQVIQKKPDCHFLIVGDGPEKNALTQLAQTLNIAQNVTFCGWVQEPLNALAAFDLFVFPSRWEGMPNTVLEAMALQKPIVCSTFEGAQELLTHAQDALVFKNQDDQDCAQKILTLIQNKELAQSLSARAKTKVEEQFSMQKMIEEYRKLYEEI